MPSQKMTMSAYGRCRAAAACPWVSFLLAIAATACIAAPPIPQARARRHPLVERTDTDTFNRIVELQGHIENEAWQDAARLLSSWRSTGTGGVAPDPRDDQRLVSLEAAMEERLRQHPALRHVLQRDYVELASLRVRRAMARRDASSLQFAALQFPGTDAAAEARRWLGDQALAAGWFRRAETQYARGMRSTTAPARHGLPARLRLAAAMQGRDSQSAVEQPVEIAGVRMTAAEFEALVAEMRGVHAPDGNPTAGTNVPPPGRWRVRRHALSVGPASDSSGIKQSPSMNSASSGGNGDRVGVHVRGNQFLLSDRFGVRSVSPADGQTRWQATLPGATGFPQTSGSFRAWRRASMVPRTIAARVLARLLTADGPVLACFDQGSGKLIWITRQDAHGLIVSDPLVSDNQVFVLTARRQALGHALLAWRQLELETGTFHPPRPLLTLRESWWEHRDCRATLHADRVFAAFGDILVSADLEGNLRWIRKQIMPPPSDGSGGVERYGEAPRVLEGKVYITHSGTDSLECVDAVSGSRLWRLALPGIRRTLGFSGPRLIVETNSHLLALHASDGTEQWRSKRSERTQPLAASGCDERHVLVSRLTSATGDGPPNIPQLVWLRARDGEPVATYDLPQLASAKSRLGPMWSVGDHLWLLSDSAVDDPGRELIELIPEDGEE